MGETGQAPGAPSMDLYEAMRTARSLRRFRPDPVPDEVLARCLEAATWAPSGSNRQGWRFVVLRSPEVRAVLGPAFRAGWDWVCNEIYGYEPRPADDDTSKAARITRTMLHLVENFENVPVYVLFCHEPTGFVGDFLEAGSIFPAVQNFLLAARVEGLGTVPSTWFTFGEEKLRAVVGIPDTWKIASLVAVGWPQGHHGPVRRKPVGKVTALDTWDNPFLPSES
ncbi:nitroreductase family protein [Frankia sp. CNm7]|uniref:Nitroreductase family protein n=1 Tax=Frankia nepalensis TaxID=1836974 RepID=A0A937RA98_9ACTN|nr:nitroreductase family protein [Frankia nepalensis]MBL7495450.1 nitroreductase family protein [Frankia nepalensis]MBL7510720.1 nitroreductase family protein [Frankia nepalensis]MBL7521683.1 nitroreductase family protein [Frankia nepalensis]MBL7626007.1 nitroreductase family protein [Frankia nepalensis]